MDLDIAEFRQLLSKEIAKGLTEAEIAAFIHKEILLTETMKANLMEEMSENTKEFLIEATAQIDTYRYELQELETDIRTNFLTVDQKAALKDTKMREKFADTMETLRELDPQKYNEEGIVDPTEEEPEE